MKNILKHLNTPPGQLELTEVLTSLPVWTLWGKETTEQTGTRSRAAALWGGKIISLVMLMEMFKAIIYWSSLDRFILWDSSAGTLSPFPVSSLLAIEMPDSWHRHR